MKHIIEKHVTSHTIDGLCGPIETRRFINHEDFPALISDLEAEWCKAMEWALNNAVQSEVKGFHYLNTDVFHQAPISTRDLLDAYKDYCNLEGKPL